MAESVLVLNAGSSSLKMALFRAATGVRLAPAWPCRTDRRRGVRATLTIRDRQVDREGKVVDHEVAMRWAIGYSPPQVNLFKSWVWWRSDIGWSTVGLYRPTVVDDAVIEQLVELSALAPPHNPPAIAGIEMARRLLPDLPHVAVFDTAFFHDLPAAASTYAIDRDLAERWQVRRYGFHGIHTNTSAAGPPNSLGSSGFAESDSAAPGNGASASAITGGRPVDTSIGTTPLEGL